APTAVAVPPPRPVIPLPVRTRPPPPLAPPPCLPARQALYMEHILNPVPGSSSTIECFDMPGMRLAPSIKRRREVEAAAEVRRARAEREADIKDAMEAAKRARKS
ncbi:hypothetical protein P7C73_g4379, partial [Tremellales sp. Uapishka_1]